MNQLPAIPTPGLPITFSDVVTVESNIAQQIATIDDVEALEEMRHKAEALASWLRGKELHGPMLGAQRRIEARIGQLLGEPCQGQRNDLNLSHAREKLDGIKRTDRERFRLLARGFDVLSDDEWRQSRTKLLEYLREKYPVPRSQPGVVVQQNGVVKKSRAQRAAEISKLVAKGYLAGQIADELGIGEEQIKSVAKAEGITLPDTALGRTNARVKTRRVIEETVEAVEAYVDGLKIIDGLPLTDISEEDARAWASSLHRSVRSISRLRRRLLEIRNETDSREETREDSGNSLGEDESVRSGAAGAAAA